MIDIDNLIKEALKSKNKVELNAYRNLKAEIQKNQTAKGAKPLDDNSQIAIFTKYFKTLQDSIKQFSEAHRGDLVSEYTSELEVIQKLIPEAPSSAQIESELLKWAKENNYRKYFGTLIPEGTNTYVTQIPKKEMGTAIKYLKLQFPTADGKVISKIVKKYVV